MLVVLPIRASWSSGGGLGGAKVKLLVYSTMGSGSGEAIVQHWWRVSGGRRVCWCGESLEMEMVQGLL